MKYLDPKADLTFKRVFGEHPDLVISFLNAMLPLPPGNEIVSIDYLKSEMVPRTPLRKNSIVDVRCRERDGRVFLVEMQMVWSREFYNRVSFNLSKAYVGQLEKGEDYHLLRPVYSLNIVNDTSEKGIDDYYHYYHMVHDKFHDRAIDNFHLVVIELPKFKPVAFSQKKMQVLWLRFLTEVGKDGFRVPPEMEHSPEVSKAIEIVEESSYTEAELLGYDKFWDIISVEKTLVNSVERARVDALNQGLEAGHAAGHAAGLAEGLAEGRAEGLAEGRAEGLAEGRAEGRVEGMEEGRRLACVNNARSMKQLGVAVDVISKVTGLSAEEIEKL